MNEIELKNCYVYRHIRLDNGEVFYIGIGINTLTNYKKPYHRAYTVHSRNRFWKNIVKKTDFIVEILFDKLSWKEAGDKETELVKFYGRRDKGEGTLVNLTDGGGGNVGFKVTEETRERMRQSQLGKKHTQEHIEKTRKALLGSKQNRKSKYMEVSNPIYQYDLQGNFIREWDGISQAVDSMDLNYSGVYACCVNKQRESKGFIWKYKKDMISTEKIDEFNKKEWTSVLQYDLEGNFVKEYKSISEAFIETGTPESSISNCLRGIVKMANKFQWKKKENENYPLKIKKYLKRYGNQYTGIKYKDYKSS